VLPRDGNNGCRNSLALFTPAGDRKAQESPGAFQDYPGVSLPKSYGSVAKVVVNGKPAGFITSPPWQREITKLVQAGQNTIEIVAVGTLKNTLGPHHGNPALGAAWPSMFQTGPYPGPPPGEQYATVGYGLFEPFQLLHVSR
jgi:hypothetical protein